MKSFKTYLDEAIALKASGINTWICTVPSQTQEITNYLVKECLRKGYKLDVQGCIIHKNSVIVSFINEEDRKIAFEIVSNGAETVISDGTKKVHLKNLLNPAKDFGEVDKMIHRQ